MDSTPKIIDLMAALKASLSQLCVCGHPYNNHAGTPNRCRMHGCECAEFSERAPDPEATP